MSYANWIEYLSKAEKKSLISESHRKVWYKFHDGQQMVEEYCIETGVIQKRLWQRKRQLMSEAEWEVEVGDECRQIGDQRPKTNIGDGDCLNPDFLSEFTIRASNTEPIVSKRVTKKNIEWRIRNLPYPLNVYMLEVDEERKAIVVKTTNHKYYKVLRVHELERCNTIPTLANITKHHQFNTLIITYRKPDIVCAMEAQVLIMLKDVETEADMSAIMARFM